MPRVYASPPAHYAVKRHRDTLYHLIVHCDCVARYAENGKRPFDYDNNYAQGGKPEGNYAEGRIGAGNKKKYCAVVEYAKDPFAAAARE